MRTILVLAILLAGCAGTDDRNDDGSQVRRAAISWVGASVDDMLQAWGAPNNAHIEATENNAGLLRWRKVRRYAGNNTSAGANHYTCIVEAYFGMNQTITRIETMTTNCDETYSPQELALLTR